MPLDMIVLVLFLAMSSFLSDLHSQNIVAFTSLDYILKLKLAAELLCYIVQVPVPDVGKCLVICTEILILDTV